MKKLTCTIMVGAPGSGKSTAAQTIIAKDPNTMIVSRDEIRKMLWGAYTPGSPKMENLVSSIEEDSIVDILTSGNNVIVDATHLQVRYIERIIQIARPYADIAFRTFHLPVEKCIENDRKRSVEKQVGEAVIRRMHKQQEVLYTTYIFHNLSKYKNSEIRKLISSPKYDPQKASAIIVDLDGTLALMADRSPYDTELVVFDILNETVLRTLRLYESNNYDVLLLSGRSEDAREATEQWLKTHNVPYKTLLMRASGDYRRDSIVKKEIYDTHIKDQYNIELVLDARDQVVQMWRSLGLTTYQVNYGKF